MKPKSDFKDLSKTIEYLEKLRTDSNYIVRHQNSYLDRIMGRLKKASDKFIIEFGGSVASRLKLGEINNIRLEGQYTLKAERLFISSISGEGVRGAIHSLKTDNFDDKKKTYYRLVIPIKKEMSFLFYFSDIGSYRTRTYWRAERLFVKINEIIFDLYQYLHGNSTFAVLECKEPIDFECFSKAATSIFLSYGFVTGYFPQDEGFYFSYTNEDFSKIESVHYLTLISSIISKYHPIYSNAHGYIDDTNEANRINPTLRGISESIFSNLCQQVFDRPEISVALFMILQGSLLTVQGMASNYSIVLETIASLVFEENKDKLSPIKDKKVAKKLRDDLTKVIEGYSTQIDASALTILKKKIENINQATNRNKLYKPFEIYKIQLNDDDIKCIASRNDFLHGRMPNTPIEVSDAKAEFRNILHIALKLYFLVSSLILKYVGFSGKIVNFARINRSFTKNKIEEDHFREI